MHLMPRVHFPEKSLYKNFTPLDPKVCYIHWSGNWQSVSDKNCFLV